MDQDLRVLFDRALDDEPVSPPGELAGAAIAEGVRLRRRRAWLIEGSVAACLAVLVALNLAAPGGHRTVESAAKPPPSACPVREAVLLLRTDVTAGQRSAVERRLHADPRLTAVTHDTGAQAYEKFKVLWKDDPDFAPSGTPLDSYQAILAAPGDLPAVQLTFRQLPGVQDVVPYPCPASGVANR